MSFKKNKYAVIRKAIPPDLAFFLANYFSLKKRVYDTCKENKYISDFERILGYYEDSIKGQVPDTFAAYADIAMESLLLMCQSKMEKLTGLKLYPAFTYARMYKKGDQLKRHKDRFSCEISTTMNLGGDPWPIYIEPDPKKGKRIIKIPGKFMSEEDGVIDIGDGVGYKSENTKGIRVDLKPGDMLVYSGCDLEHWREKFKGDACVQVFLHYNNQKTPNAKKNIFDKRPHLGLPLWFKNLS